MPQIKAYTAIIGGKDKPRNDIKVFDDFNKFNLPVMNAKIYKVMPHKFLDCDISIWMDGNIFPKVPHEQLVKEWLGDNDMMVFKHWHRESIHWEMKWIEYQFRHRKDSPILKNAQKQMDYYKSINFPRKSGVYYCGFIIRRHNKVTEQFNEKWWAEITRWSARDQLSFPVVLSTMPELKLHALHHDIRKHPYFDFNNHLIPS